MIPTLRSATPEDAELIAALTRACWVGKPADSSGHQESAESVRQSLYEGEAIVLEQHGEAIGSVRLYPVFDVDANGEKIGPVALELGRLGILPAQRGRGLWTWLMNEAATRATQRGIEELRLAVRNDEPRLQAFYERQGFVVDTSLVYTHANPNNPPPIVMRKFLFGRVPQKSEWA